MSILLKNAAESLINLISRPHAEKWIQSLSVAAALESIKLYGPDYLQVCRAEAKLEKGRKAETYLCESNGIEYQIDPEDGSVDLVPPDEMEIAAIKAECLEHYDREMEKAKENHAENRGLEMEQRRVG